MRRAHGFFVVWWRCYDMCTDLWPQRPISAIRCWAIMGYGEHFKS